MRSRNRRILHAAPAELGAPLGDVLLQPHRCYAPQLQPVLGRCKGIAHITGGAIAENLARILPPGAAARLRRGTWPEPPIFALIQRSGDITEAEMFRVFNMGLGLIVAVAPMDVAALLAVAPAASVVGEITAANGTPAVEIAGAG